MHNPLAFKPKFQQLYCPIVGHDEQEITAVCLFPNCKINQKGCCYDCYYLHLGHTDQLIKVPEIERFINTKPDEQINSYEKDFKIYMAELQKQLKLITEIAEQNNRNSLQQLVSEEVMTHENLNKISAIMGQIIQIKNKKICNKEDSNNKNKYISIHEKLNQAIDSIFCIINNSNEKGGAVNNEKQKVNFKNGLNQQKTEDFEGNNQDLQQKGLTQENQQIIGQKELNKEGNQFLKGNYNCFSRQGRGVLQLPDGIKYTGDWIGQFHGKGEQEWPFGQKYTGDFVFGRKEGQGVIKYADGRFYNGQYRNDMRNGQGEYVWQDGNKYVGDWVDDRRNGHGVFTWPNGEKYVGNFVDDKRNGKGEFFWPNGDKYAGNYVDEMRQGQGEFTWKDGTVYKGEFNDDKFHGYGTKYYKNGQIEYQGGWFQDEPTYN